MKLAIRVMLRNFAVGIKSARLIIGQIICDRLGGGAVSTSALSGISRHVRNFAEKSIAHFYEVQPTRRPGSRGGVDEIVGIFRVRQRRLKRPPQDGPVRGAGGMGRPRRPRHDRGRFFAVENLCQAAPPADRGANGSTSALTRSDGAGTGPAGVDFRA